MRAFAEAFFTRFGARTFNLNDELVVDLPTDLADCFGKPRLYLVFTKDTVDRELSPVEDLLVYGSRVFDQMMALLEGRGEETQLCLPTHFLVDTPQALPLPMHNCQVVESQVHTDDARYYIFNFRTVYLSDEKQEDFITIVLDSQGHHRPDKVDELTNGDTFCTLAHPLSIAPVTLRRMLDRTGEIAREHAYDRAADLEIAAWPRLEKALLRLSTFYGRLSEEVDSGDPTQDVTTRAELKRELTRKINDELERHRLHVTLFPISYAVALIPTAQYRLTLTTRHTQQALELDQDLHTGHLESCLCFHCQKPIEQLALCDRGKHPVHPECLATCFRCDRDVCQTCDIQPCAICGKPVCFDCMVICTQCDQWLCPEQVADCPTCGEPVCERCSASCAICNISLCNRHLSSCLVCGVQICAEHSWPCHVCGRESCETHADLCPVCGEPYCTDHRIRCQSCGQGCCTKCGVDKTCDTCRQALDSPTVPDAMIPRVPGIRTGAYSWKRAKNREHAIYLGRRRLGRAVIVTDRAGRPVHHHKTGLLRTISKKLSNT